MKFNWRIILLITSGILLYANCLHNEMFWDDNDFITQNQYVQNWSDWKNYFTQSVTAGHGTNCNYWRPLLLGFFSVEWHIFHNSVIGYHLVSIIFHVVCGVLLYKLIQRLFKSIRNIPFFISLLWLAHPMHNESVVYANSLGDQLFTIFVLSGILLYQRNYWLSLLCYPLALMSKETGIILMPLIILIESIQGRWKSTLTRILPFVAIAGTYLWLRATVLNFAGSFNFYQQPIAFEVRLATFFSALAWYVGFIMFPYQLRVERVLPFYDFNTPVINTWNGFVSKTGVLSSAYDGGGWGVFISPFTFAPWIGMMIFLFAVIVFFKYFKTKPLISMGIGWFFIAWLPMANLFNMINSTFYEHFMYVPIIGFLIMVFGVYNYKNIPT